MAENSSHKKEYFIVFIALAVLTAIEIAIPELVHNHTLKVTSLTGLAIGKACMVAYFYMHLKEETRWLRFIAAVPICAAFFAALVVIESIVR